MSLIFFGSCFFCTYVFYFYNRANINIDMTTSYGGETFLSEEVAINLLQLTKTAFRRVQVLSSQKGKLCCRNDEIFLKLKI